MNNKCVYLHKTKEGVVFYVGSGTLERAYRKTARNNIWKEYAEFGFVVEIVKSKLTKTEAIILEKQLVLDLKPVSNKSKPSHVKDITSLYNLFSEYFTISNSNSGLIWRVKSKNNKIAAGSVAGSLGKNNRWQVKLNNKLYLCHRIVYLLHYGGIDPSMVIDHINGDSSDNRIENLRQVSNTLNSINRIRNKDDTLFNIQYYKGRQEYFVVRWQEKGSRVSKYFAINKNQNIEKARQLAIEFRDKLILDEKLILRN